MKQNMFPAILCLVMLPLSVFAADLKGLARQRNDEGMERYKQEKYEAAAVKFEEAVSLDKEYLRAHLNWASALCRGDYQTVYDRLPQVYEIIGKAYKIDPGKTFAAIYDDPDLEEVRQKLSYERTYEGDQRPANLVKAFNSYRAGLRSKMTTFVSKPLQISFDYPVMWTVTSSDYNSDHDSSSLIRAADFKDPKGFEGDVGDPYDMYLTVEQHDKNLYKRETITDYYSQEPLTPETVKTPVAGTEGELIKYVNGSAEGGRDVVRRLEFQRQGFIYVFTFKRGFNGEPDQKAVAKDDMFIHELIGSIRF